MNTYRVYLLDTTVALSPVVHTVYIQAEKYGPAWAQSRAVASRKQEPNTPTFTLDAEGKQPFVIPGRAGDVVIAKISDMTVRNVKLDKTALQAILDDPKATADEKLAAMQGFLQTGKGPTPAPTPEPEATPAAGKGKGAKQGEQAAA